MEETEEKEKDMFDNIERILDDDVALGFVSNKFDGMNKEKIRGIAKPLIKILKTRGVDIFSAGDEARAGKIQSSLNTMNSYTALFVEFLPVLKAIYDYIKEGKSNGKLADDEWNDMMFEEQTQQPQQQQQQPQGVDPNFLKQQGQPQQQQQQGNRAYAGQGNAPQPPKKGGLTMAMVLENHRKKYGSSGLSDVVNELEQKGGIHLDVNVEDDPKSPKSVAYKPSGIAGLTMKDIAARHKAKFGDKGMEKVYEEMQKAHLETGVDTTQPQEEESAPQPKPKPRKQQRVADNRGGMFEEEYGTEANTSVSDEEYDEEDEEEEYRTGANTPVSEEEEDSEEQESSQTSLSDIPSKRSQDDEGVDEGFKQACRKAKSRLNDMPRPSIDQYDEDR